MKREEWWLTTRAQDRLFIREWIPTTRDAQAIVCLVHGQGEHGERYHHIATQLTNGGFIVVALDLYGHGRSDGKRGHMSSMATTTQYIMAFIDGTRNRHSNLPVFLYGHSMGGNIALNCVLSEQPVLQGLILTSPWLKLAFQPSRLKEWLGSRLASLLPSLQVDTGLKEEQLYRPTALNLPSTNDDPLHHTCITLKAYTEVQEAGEGAIDRATMLQFPVLLLHGDNDSITSYRASEQLAKRIGPGCSWHPWPNGLHELHNDQDWELVVKTIMHWLEKQLLS